MVIDGIAEAWGQPSEYVPVPEERFSQYEDRVPAALLEVWRTYGFSGFGDGMFWLCDPEEWQPVVDVWTKDLDLEMGADSWLAVARSAFGWMKLWGQRTGMSLTIVPYLGLIFPADRSDKMGSEVKRMSQTYAALTPSREALDQSGEDGSDLYRRVFERLGSVGPGTMYGFVPALALGGIMMPENVEIVDAVVHLQLLSEVTPRRVLHDPYGG